MDKTPLNLIFLGDPASGKATQAARLAKKYNLYDFDMGKELRKPAVRVRGNYAKTAGIGRLSPTAVVRDILRRVIRTAPRNKGILFNGHPKMIGEAKLVARQLKQYKRSDPLVIYLTIPAGEIARRAKARREYAGGKLVRRSDDAERALRNRRRYYKEQISRVTAFFKTKYAFKNISGVGSRTAVAERIKKIIDRYAS